MDGHLCNYQIATYKSYFSHFKSNLGNDFSDSPFFLISDTHLHLIFVVFENFLQKLMAKTKGNVGKPSKGESSAATFTSKGLK